MNTQNILARLTPLIAHHRDRGAFEPIVVRDAPGWATELATSANEEGYDAVDAIEAILVLARADAFEPQQQAYVTAIAACDELLGAIALNVAETFRPVPPQRTVAQLLDQLAQQTRDARNVVSVTPAVVRSVIATGEQLEKTVRSEIAAGRRTAGDLATAHGIYEGTAEVVTCSFARREEEAGRVLVQIARLAA